MTYQSPNIFQNYIILKYSLIFDFWYKVEFWWGFTHENVWGTIHMLLIYGHQLTETNVRF